MKKQTQKQTQAKERGNLRLNTPYFSAGDYEKPERPTPSSLDFLKSGIVFTSERSILEFLGQKVTLEITELTALYVPIVETRADGTQEKTTEQRAFFKMKFPNGTREYYFPINKILAQTLAVNGIVPAEHKLNQAVNAHKLTLEQLSKCVGQTISGYFYYTAENGSGKRLFASADSLEKYHNAIQAKFENSIEQLTDQSPQEQENAN